MADPVKINYQKECEKILASIPEGSKPRLLLHVCCGPCACFPLVFLCKRFKVTIYYANSNIYPAEEYAHRLSELEKLVSYLHRDLGFDIDMVVPPYENEEFTTHLAPLKDEPEGGKRCVLCYSMRMKESYAYAKEHGYEFFTTVMSVSRQKDSQKFNEIGKSLEPLYAPVRYLYSDFKKNKGQEIGVEIRKKYDLYNQCYCGCVYSYEEMKLRTANQQKE